MERLGEQEKTIESGRAEKIAAAEKMVVGAFNQRQDEVLGRLEESPNFVGQEDRS